MQTFAGDCSNLCIVSVVSCITVGVVLCLKNKGSVSSFFKLRHG